MSVKRTTVTITTRDLKKILKEKFKSKIKNIYWDIQTSGDPDYGNYKQFVNSIEFEIND